MSFTEIFGGTVIYPAWTSYIFLELTGDVTLQWPIEQQVGGNNIVADIIDLSGEGESTFFVTLPDARQVSTGFTSLFNNVGEADVSILDALGGTIVTLASGEAWQIYLTDNSIEEGIWTTFQYGAGTSTADAGGLAGSGLKAITTTLNLDLPADSHPTDYVILNADRANPQVWTGGVGNFTLPNPATVGSGWFVPLANQGSGSVTVTPAAGTIDGSSTLILAVGESAFAISNGTNYFTVGLGQSVNTVFDFISINVAGTGNYTLAGAELNRIAYEFTGVLSGNRNIIVPAAVQQYWVDNQTSGAFSLTVKTLAGTGIAVVQGTRSILYCDGTDVVNAETLSGVTFADGSAASPSITFASAGTTSLFNSVGALGISTGGTQRLLISTAGVVTATGNWTWNAPASGTTLTVNNNSSGPGVTAKIQSSFSSAATSPLLSLLSSAAGGFATLSICGNNGTIGTNDLAIFQNGANGNASVLNRNNTSTLTLQTTGANANILVAPNGTTVATFAVGASHVTIGVGGFADSLRFNTLTQTSIGAAGGAAALPATPLGYMTVSVNGASVKIPYYNP